jgi:hypothetical protein
MGAPLEKGPGAAAGALLISRFARFAFRSLGGRVWVSRPGVSLLSPSKLGFATKT